MSATTAGGRRWRAGTGRRTSILALIVVVLAAGSIAGCTISSTAQSPPPSAPPVALSSITCPSSSDCLAIGGTRQLLESTDAALTWTPRTLPTDHYLYGISCLPGIRCVAVGDDGTILVSRGEGQHWSRVESGTRQPLMSVTCTGPESCYAVGDGNTVLVTSDGGGHWQGVTESGLQVLNGVACASLGRCVAVTSNATQILRTTDGIHWVGATVRAAFNLAVVPVNSVSCEASTCVAVGSGGLIASSRDGGASWSVGNATVTNENLNGVSCTTANRCTAIGSSGTILTTADGGRTWVRAQSHTTQTLLGVDCKQNAPCVAVGDAGTILSVPASVETWQLRRGEPAPPGEQLSVLVVGDSFAHTVALFVGRNSSPYGVRLVDGGLDGCDLARGATISLPDSGACATTGSGWPALYRSDIDGVRPDLSLIVLGPLDLSARLIDGQWLSPGQPAYDSYYESQLSSAVRILTSRGTRVAIATVPYVLQIATDQCVPPPSVLPDCPTQAQRVDALDRVAAAVAAQHPGEVTLIDLGQHLSPGGRFAMWIDGVTVRASDGTHLSQPGGEWLAPWLVPRLLAAAGRS